MTSCLMVKVNPSVICRRSAAGTQTSQVGFEIWKPAHQVPLHVTDIALTASCHEWQYELVHKTPVLQKSLHRLQRHFCKQKLSSWKTIHITPQKIQPSMKWSKKDCKTAQVCTIIAGAEKQGCYHAVATIVLCLMPIFTLHVSIFPGMQRAGTKGTAPGSDGGCYGRSAVPRWRLDLRLPLIGITGILWPTLSYEYLKLWARRQVWCFFPILEPISKKPVVEKGSSCSVKVILMGYINFLLQNSSPPKPVKSLKDPETPKRWYHGQTIREFFSTAHLLCSWTAVPHLPCRLGFQLK